MLQGLDLETLEMTLESINEFARRELKDEVLIELDEKDEFPEDIVRRMCGEELGVQLVFIPEEYSGMGGNAYDVYRTCEAMAHIDCGIATAVLATFLGSDPIMVGGTPEQKARWYTAIAEEGLLMAYGATEPDAGSDLGALKTVAKPVRNDAGEIEGYKITGAKQWISNGSVADLYSVLALTEGGPTWFILDKGTEGFTAGKPENKHGIRLSNTAPLFLEDAYAEVDRLVGGVEGQGLVQAQLVFGYTRLMVAAFGLGCGWAAVDRAIPYSVDRIQGGASLSTKQGYTHKLIVPNVVALEAGRAAIEETAEAIDADTGDLLNTEGAIAKYLATEAGNKAAEDAIQALGGYGYVHEYLVEKIKRDVRITTIYEGTSEIMEMTVARDRWQFHLKTRGQHYHTLAAELDALPAETGGPLAGLAYHTLAEVLEACRAGRLTRNQHVLFKMGRLIALAEGAAALARRAHRMAQGQLSEKTSRRLDTAATAAAARINARDVALTVATDGIRWVVGAGGDPSRINALLPNITAAQAGNVADMDALADFIYSRTPALAGAAA
jgi:alkylation response protein AidB-like acyl-CoA dehydrogenase